MTMPSTNGAAVRDERGRYLKGMPGGPGRPLGSRNKLTEDFLGDMHATWLERGCEVIDRIITERPEVYLLAMLKLAQVYRVEVGQPKDFDRPATKEEVFRRLEERWGPEARNMLESFFAGLEKLKPNNQ